jgi:hypothetical protein
MIRLIWSYIMKWGWDYNRNGRSIGNEPYPSKQLSISTDSNEFGDPIRFSVTPANGGVVVTVRTYDKLKDRSKETVHVIPDNTDYAKAVGDLVAMEILKS